MSKYRQRGAYHFDEFARETPYRHHVIDLVETVVRHVPSGSSILEIGCGEGLIMSQLEKRGFDCYGCDIDAEAVRLAGERGIPVEHGGIEVWADDEEFDAVLFSDSLEHIEDPDDAVDTAKGFAQKALIIAIPSVHDRHAIRQMTPKDVMDAVGWMNDWTLVYNTTRHARHLMVFEKVPPNGQGD